jgi:hypothetical protein
MARPYLKARGIYATGLTRLFLDAGYGITQPSREIVERFQIPETKENEDVSIMDRDDKQGIQISGKKASVDQLIRYLWDVCIDMVVRRDSLPEGLTESEDIHVRWDIEFPGASKAVLDRSRGRVVPTMRHHHRLRIIASDYVDLIEREIARAPHRQDRLEREFMGRFLYQPLNKAGMIRFEHVKPEGQILNLREGEIVAFEEDELLVRRHFHQGRYDGLDLPVEPGDYGLTKVAANAWSLRHRYFAKGGVPKGTYWNVNTPVELYPDRIRYVDLHVDVVRRGKGAPRIIDQERLGFITRHGFISTRLQEKALGVSWCLLNQLRGSD